MVRVSLCTRIHHSVQVEVNSQNSSVSYRHAGSRNQTQVVGLGSKRLYQLSSLARPHSGFFMQFSHMDQQEHVSWKDVNMFKSRSGRRQETISWLGKMFLCLWLISAEGSHVWQRIKLSSDNQNLRIRQWTKHHSDRWPLLQHASPWLAKVKCTFSF